MGRKSKFSKELKLEVIKQYEEGNKSIGQLAFGIGCNKSAIIDWINNYSSIGKVALVEKPRNKSYTKEIKMAAVNDYLSGLGSLRDIQKKYGILSNSTLRNWIMKYNCHIEIKNYNPKGDVYMTKSRKTTYEERLEIVNYCISHNKEYKLAAEHFNIPYSQVYQWVKKYLEQGQQGLLDRRGRTKLESELTETEKLKRDNQILQVKIEQLQMENEVLKKLEEIERRRGSAKSGKKRNI